MGEAALWGLVASSSLVLGSLLALAVRPSQRANGLVMAFGSGVLISAIAYELVAEALDVSGRLSWVAVGLGLGALAFYLGDLLIDRAGGEHRKRSTGAQADGSSRAIALGALLDGVPESIVLGLSQLLGEGISVALLAAVFVSNIPEAVAATSGLPRSGWSKWRILGMWTAIAVGARVRARRLAQRGRLIGGGTGSAGRGGARERHGRVCASIRR